MYLHKDNNTTTTTTTTTTSTEYTPAETKAWNVPQS
jgi:hypothetical protein